MNRIAARERFLVLYPEQDRLANAQGCWNWFDTRTGRAQREARDHRCGDRPGLPAPAGRPQAHRHRRVVGRRRHGGAAGDAAARALPRGRDAFGRRARTRAFVGDRAERDARPAQSMLPLPSADGASGWPPLLVIQGSADRVVAAENGAEAVRLWAAHAQRTNRARRASSSAARGIPRR